MSAKLSFDDQRHQNSFIRFAQQLAGITDQENIWCQIGQAIFHFFDADLVGFLELSASGQWKAHYWILPPDCTEEDVFTPALQQTAAKVLESSFMASESLDLNGACQVAVFPVAVDNRRTAIMLIGHSVSTPIGKDLLNIYLGVAGLVGGTVTRAGVLARLRQDNKSMRQIFADNSSDARLRNIVENALEIIYTLTPEGMISYASPRWTQLIGHQSHDLLGRSFVSFLHPSDRAVFQSYFAAVNCRQRAKPTHRISHRKLQRLMALVQHDSFDGERFARHAERIRGNRRRHHRSQTG